MASVDRAGAGGEPLAIRAFEPGDEPAVLELLNVAFGGWPPQGTDRTPSEFFRWKHLESPFGRSLMVVVELRGAIAGFYAYMPWLLSADGRTITTMRAVDLAIDPRHRRQGISLALRSATQYPREVEFVWGNPNSASAAGGRRLGRPEVRGLRSFVRPCSALSRSLRPRVLRPRARPAKPISDDHPAARTLNDQGLLDRLQLPAELHPGRLATLKHGDYLRWRYGRSASYRAVWLDAPGEGGLAIFRRRRHGRFAVADVCEMLLERRDAGLERRVLARVAETTRADFILCNFPSPRSAASRGLVGYRTRETLMALVLGQDLAPDPRTPDSWALSRGDLELL